MLKDGPAPHGECEHCHFTFIDDIYFYRGWKLCGDCRYEMRHGHLPPRPAPPGMCGPLDDISPWQENAIRCLEGS